MATNLDKSIFFRQLWSQSAAGCTLRRVTAAVTIPCHAPAVMRMWRPC